MVTLMSFYSPSRDEEYDVFQLIAIIIPIDDEMVPILASGRLFN